MRILALSLSNHPLFSTSFCIFFSALDELVHFWKFQPDRSYSLDFYTADEGHAQISALHLIEAREVPFRVWILIQARKAPHMRTLQIFKLLKIFR
ncbi:hypothetical protein HA466_0263920 [Hirschfeldia incana]|nr:hypothetical protein HA466_0263920 [Hirschfeldia incana]